MMTPTNKTRYPAMPTPHPFLLALLLLLLWCPATTLAEMRPLLKNRAGVPPTDVLKEILATQHGEPHERDIMPGNDAAPFITWLADPDARIQPHHIISRPERKIFAARSLGNQINASLDLLDFGIRHLRSPMLLITGNTDSETLRLFSSGYSGLELTVRQELDHLNPALGGAAATAGSAAGEGERRKVEENVDYQVSQAMVRYGDRVASGRLVVVGSVFDIADRYGRGAGRLSIININGETDGDTLKKMGLLRTINPKLLTFVGRPAARDMEKTGKGK